MATILIYIIRGRYVTARLRAAIA